jgi:hypothetical protein
MPQSYASHAHHPVQSYIAIVFTLIAMVTLIGTWLFDWSLLHLGVVSLSFAVAVLVSISRAYITRLQDRIIMLEMQVRTAGLLPVDQVALLSKLTPKQIVALRFASDEELSALLARAASENLPPRVIKQSIKNWRPDHYRT